MQKKFLIVLLCASLLLLSLFNTDVFPLLRIQIVYCADSSNNQIDYVEVWQWNVIEYILLANWSESGQSVRVVDSKPLKFVVGIRFNNTLASSTNQAIEYTRVYMNISEGIWNNEELNNTSCSLVGDFYVLTEEGIWNQEGKPEAGVIYECQVKYEGYY